MSFASSFTRRLSRRSGEAAKADDDSSLADHNVIGA
jgi:hypothetical protein